MANLSAIAATALDATEASTQDRVLAMTIGGLWFGVIGFLLVTDYKGGRRWILDRTELPGPLRRFYLRFMFGGDQQKYERARKGLGLLPLGWLFLLVGVSLLLVVVVGGLVLFVKSVL